MGYQIDHLLAWIEDESGHRQPGLADRASNDYTLRFRATAA